MDDGDHCLTINASTGVVHLDKEEVYLKVTSGVDGDVEVYTVKEDACPRCT